MKKLLAGLSLVLVLGLAVGGTLALFNTTSNELTNTFTAGSGVSLDIKEPTWDGTPFEGEQAPTADLGRDVAKNFAPNEVIAKDPTLKNTSEEVSVFVAMTISYGEGIGSYADLEAFANIDFNENNWEISADKTVAYYKGAVVAGAKTEPLFTKVSIKKDADSNSMKNFDIKVKGYAVQESGSTNIINIREVLNAQFLNLVK